MNFKWNFVYNHNINHCVGESLIIGDISYSSFLLISGIIHYTIFFLNLIFLGIYSYIRGKNLKVLLVVYIVSLVIIYPLYFVSTVIGGCIV